MTDRNSNKLTLTYDGDRRLTKVETAPAREPTRTGDTYDQEDRIVSVSVDGTEVASYGCAPYGARLRRTENGEATYFLDDPRDFNGFNDVVGEFNGTGVMKAKYLHGPGIDEPLAKFSRDENPQGAWYYYHVDGLGSVTRLTRGNKSVANRYVYDDFGRFRSGAEAVPNPYGFTGRESDVPGLGYYRARYYDHDTGRFLSRDPAGMIGGPNVYEYVGNNPQSLTDPAGLVPPRRSGQGGATGPIYIAAGPCYELYVTELYTREGGLVAAAKEYWFPCYNLRPWECLERLQFCFWALTIICITPLGEGWKPWDPGECQRILSLVIL